MKMKLHRRRKTRRQRGGQNHVDTNGDEGGGKKVTNNVDLKPSCAPHRNAAEKKEFTCFTDAALIKLRDTWNARHPSDNERIKATDSKGIWTQLKKNMQSTCSQETCWLKQNIFKNIDDKNLLNFTFSPTAPKSWNRNPNEWLSSLEITDVMKQYEKEYPEFDFIGPSPIDFMTKEFDGKCVWQELCTFSVAKQLERKKTKIGIIFNTDPHDKSGSHWISLFINLENNNNVKPFVFFFDSNGTEAPKEVQAFIKNIVKPQAASAGLTLTEDTNADTKTHKKVQHQRGNTECGMYSLYLIISLLTKTEKHKNYQDFIDKTKIVTDADMTALRHKLFNIVAD